MSCLGRDVYIADIQMFAISSYLIQIVIVFVWHFIGKTGVEMEALTGASVAALTINDLSLIHI